jgi:serine/threonine protein kinase
VRGLLEQIAKGLQAFHRLEMVYQDLKPDNIMIDSHRHREDHRLRRHPRRRHRGNRHSPIEQINLLGAAALRRAGIFPRRAGLARSDLFSLGVIAYQMLSGGFPTAQQVPKSRTRAAQKKLAYQSVLTRTAKSRPGSTTPSAKAVEPDPFERYEELSEFVFDLHHPNQAFLNKTKAAADRAASGDVLEEGCRSCCWPVMSFRVRRLPKSEMEPQRDGQARRCAGDLLQRGGWPNLAADCLRKSQV